LSIVSIVASQLQDIAESKRLIVANKNIINIG